MQVYGIALFCPKFVRSRLLIGTRRKELRRDELHPLDSAKTCSIPLKACGPFSSVPFQCVVYQYDLADPLNPLGLLIAYAEERVRRHSVGGCSTEFGVTRLLSMTFGSSRLHRFPILPSDRRGCDAICFLAKCLPAWPPSPDLFRNFPSSI